MSNSEISEAFLKLADTEAKVEQIDNEIEQLRIQKLGPIYRERDEYISHIPEFWKIVLSQHVNFANYIRATDFKYVDCIDRVTVEYDSERDKIGSFKLTFYFNEIPGDFPKQTVTKNFKLVKVVPDDDADRDENEDEGEERLISEAVDIAWPKEYDSINPALIKDKHSTEGKRNYRTGMKSFFGWFKWTGTKPGKEYPHGDDLARLFSEDLYPYCVKYYTEAQRDLEDEQSDDSEDHDDSEEPLELSDVGEEEKNGEHSEPFQKKPRRE